VGMTKFEKPGVRAWDYPDMAKEAISKALNDAGLKYEQIQQAVVGYVYGNSTSGQRAVYSVGLTGIPVYNVNNNCSTGSTALFMAKQLVEGNIADCILAIGFEKMERGSLKSGYSDRTDPMEPHMKVMAQVRGVTNAPFAPQLFGNAGKEYMEKYGVTKEQLAKIAEKNHRHSTKNPYAQFREEYSLADILRSKTIFEPLTLLQCSPTSEGSAAAIVVSEEFVRKHKLESQAVEIVAQCMRTDFPIAFEGSMMEMVGFTMVKKAADTIYQTAGITANDVQVIELHDCFSTNELITYEALGLCETGQAGKLLDDGAVTHGGKWVVNPSGGLISKGHPLGATGIAQCAELCWQLRGMATNRQVPKCKYGLSHNIGLGGAVVITLYKLGFPEQVKPWPQNKPNPAVSDVGYDPLKIPSGVAKL